MKNSVVVFLMTGNNHLSNVKTLQSVYSQDYPDIRLIVCNDCTYGFENERLLNNFEHNRPANIQQIVYQENPRTVGEYATQAPFWKKIPADFFVTLHAGEYFTSPHALRDCVQRIKGNTTLSAILCNCERWDDAFKKCAHRTDAARLLADITAAVQENEPPLAAAELHDCMVVYRRSALLELTSRPDEKCTNISSELLPELIRSGKTVSVYQESLCRFSVGSVNTAFRMAPTEFGNGNLEKIARLLKENPQRATEAESTLAQPTLPAAPKPKKRNIFVLLRKLSTVANMLIYVVVTLLLAVGGALFLNLKTPLFAAAGIAFLVLAAMAALWTVFMLCCNLYLKKNPQRLVM